MRNNEMIKQKIVGFLMIIFCVLVYIVSSKGFLPEVADTGAVIFLLPLGVYCIITKNLIIW